MTPVTRLTVTGRRRAGRRVLASAVTIAVSSVAAVAGCATDRNVAPRPVGEDDARNLGGVGNGPAQYSEVKALQETNVAAAQAAATAYRTLSGKIESIELELEHAIPTWEVDVLTARGTWHELEIDGVGGAVLTNHTEIDGEDPDEVVALKAARLTVTEAIAVAVRSARGTVFSAELDDHVGRRSTWRIQTLESNGIRHQRSVDAATGTVASKSPDKIEN
jgi:uncharacterized membrane protein YkoI